METTTGQTEQAEQTPEENLLNGRYRLLRPIGQGGMGTVFLAEHVRLDTIVAVKEVRADEDSVDDVAAALAQCEFEARTLVKLSHPNLPSVKDAFIENGRFYLVMEYIEGVTLETKLKESGNKPLDTALVVDWGLQIADVLAYLHAQEPSIIFRDMKPANVMVQPDGNIRLIDFGIARRFQPGATKDTALLGSVGYSPPEQFGRHQTDTRSDIYAFGATLHHLLTGLDPAASPFKFKTVSEINFDVPAALSQLLAHCVALDADARPQNIHEVALRLVGVRDGLSAAPLSPGGAWAAQEITLGDGVEPIPGSPSGPPPPRIISTKLAEAEAQKRKTGSRDRSESPSGPYPPVPPASGRIPSPLSGSGTMSGAGAMTSASLSEVPAVGPPPVLPPSAIPNPNRAVSVPVNTSRATWIPLGVSVVVALGFAGLVISQALRPHSPPIPPVANGTATNNGMGRNQPGMPPNANPQAVPSLNPTGSEAPPPINDPNATLEAQTQGLDTDANGAPVVHIAVTGHVSVKSAPIRVAAYFYNGDDQPIAAADPNGQYANPDHQASIAQNITPAQDGTFSTRLDVPLSALPPDSLSSQIKYRCVMFTGSPPQRAQDTLMVSLPTSLSGQSGTVSPNNSSNPNGASGTGSGTSTTPNSANGSGATGSPNGHTPNPAPATPGIRG